MKHFYTVVLAVYFILMLAVPALSLIPRGDGGGYAFPPKASLSGGKLKVYLHEKNEVVSLKAEEYLFGVLAGEISFDCGDEALKAQIVAAYTFAMRRAEERRASPDESILGADITDDCSVDQVYLDEAAAREKLGDSYDACRTKFIGLMEEAGGLCLRYDGELILAVYHAVSGGRTESAAAVWGTDFPYLQPVESIGDLLAPNYLTTVSYSTEEFLQRLGEMEAGVNGDDAAPIPDAASADCAALVSDTSCTESGTVTECTINSKTYTGQQIRQYFGLHSANFELKYADGSFTFTVRGYGHGVGMSQTGAAYMAEQGSSFREILSWYYPGASVEEY